MKNKLHGYPIEHLVRDQILVKSRGAHSNQISGLVVDRILLVAYLHHRRLELNMRLIYYIFGLNHLVDVYWLGPDLLTQLIVFFIHQDRQWHLVLSSTLHVN